MQTIYRKTIGNRLFLALFCAAILGALLPIYNLYILQPEIIELLNEETQHDAISLAKSFSTLLLKDPSKEFSEGLSTAQSTTLVELKEQLSLFKVKLFAPDHLLVFLAKHRSHCDEHSIHDTWQQLNK